MSALFDPTPMLEEAKAWGWDVLTCTNGKGRLLWHRLTPPADDAIAHAVSAAHGFIDAPGEPSTPVMDDVMEQAAEAMRGIDAFTIDAGGNET